MSEEMTETAIPSSPSKATTAVDNPPPSPEKPSKRDQKIAKLTTQITSLTSQIASTSTSLTATNAQLKDPSAAQQIVQRYITLLHTYNEIKDVGQGLMSMIADARGERCGDVQAEFGVGAKD